MPQHSFLCQEIWYFLKDHRVLAISAANSVGVLLLVCGLAVVLDGWQRKQAYAEMQQVEVQRAADGPGDASALEVLPEEASEEPRAQLDRTAVGSREDALRTGRLSAPGARSRRAARPGNAAPPPGEPQVGEGPFSEAPSGEARSGEVPSNEAQLSQVPAGAGGVIGLRQPLAEVRRRPPAQTGPRDAPAPWPGENVAAESLPPAGQDRPPETDSLESSPADEEMPPAPDDVKPGEE